MHYKGELIEKNIDVIKKQLSENIPIMEIARSLHVKYETLIKHLKRLKIDFKTNPHRKGMIHYESRVPVEHYLNNHSHSIISAAKLRKKLIEEGLKENKCERCGITEWFGGEVPLELHHLDGNHYNNNFDNLIILCSNCHAQIHGYNKDTIKPKLKDKKPLPKKQPAHKKVKKTEYFCEKCGKKLKEKSKTGLCSDCVKFSQRKVERPSKEELINLISKLSYVEIGKQFGVSDKTIVKWCKFYDIDYKSIHKIR